MFLTGQLLKKAGWVPRSRGVPGRQWIGKNKRVKVETIAMRKSKRVVAQRTAEVERYIEFPYLTEAEAKEDEEAKLAETYNREWQKRILGRDVFGLGLGKPSMLDHLMVSDTRRYAPVKLGALSDNTIK